MLNAMFGMRLLEVAVLLEEMMGKTAWLRTKPRAAKVARRNHDTGRGRDKYRLAVCVPVGLEETRRERGPRAKSESS